MFKKGIIFDIKIIILFLVLIYDLRNYNNFFMIMYDLKQKSIESILVVIYECIVQKNMYLYINL